MSVFQNKDGKTIRRDDTLTSFSARPTEMLMSPAYRSLSLSAHRVMSRIEVELRHHGGRDNGKLPVTFEDFMEYGLDRHAIAPAIRELEALGFIEVTERGRAGNAEHRSANKFRLTFTNNRDKRLPSHEWRKVKTMEEAELLARAARAAKTRAAGTGPKENPQVIRERKKIRIPVGVFTNSRWGFPTLNPKIPVGVSHTTGIVRFPPLLSISREHSDRESPSLCPPSVSFAVGRTRRMVKHCAVTLREGKRAEKLRKFSGFASLTTQPRVTI